MTVTRKVYFQSGKRGGCKICRGETEALPELIAKPNRQAEYMSFAIVFDDWLQVGKATCYEDLARITGLSRFMVAKIMAYRLKPVKEQERIISN